jgi:microcystin-dependent protein
MSQVAIQGDVSGTGIFTIPSPNSNTNRTLTLPDASGTILVSGSSGLTPAGTVIIVGMNSAPTGYLKANGAAVSRSTYATLFSVVGTTYGAGNGSTTFNLPDLRGNFTRNWDDGRGVDSGRALGSTQLVQTNNAAAFQTAAGASTIHGETAVDEAGNYSAYRKTGRNDAGNGAGMRMRNRNVETRPRNRALLACIKF